jgi:hypothetical protein
MRLPFCALFLLTASRVLATAMASAYCGSTSQIDNGSFPEGPAFAGASCTAPGSLSASASVFLNGPTGASISLFQFGSYARASASDTYVLYVTGGSGIGTYHLLASESLNADVTDEGYVDVKLGGTEFALDNTGNSKLNFYGTFTYGIPQIMPFEITASVAAFPFGIHRAGVASAFFNGIEILDSNNPNALSADAVVSLQRAPEPSFAFATALCLLAFTARRKKKSVGS